MGGAGLLSWCVRCLGVGGAEQSLPTNPLASTYTRVHRTVSTSREDDSDDSGEEKEGEEDEEESFVHRHQPGSATPLLHPPAAPPTVAIRVQPRAVPLHHPDLHSPRQWPPSPEETPQDSTDSSTPVPASPPASPATTTTTTTSYSHSPASSTRGSLQSLHSLHSLTSLRSTSSALPPPEELGNGESPRRRVRFLTPEEAARPPQDNLPPRLIEYPQSGKSGWARGGDMLRSLFGMEDDVNYVGHYTLHGNKQPTKLRSHTTIHAISSFHSRAETSSTPLRYSFGKVVLALRYQSTGHMLEVRVKKVSQLPPGKENLKVDLQVSIVPGKKERWVKGVVGGQSQPEDAQPHSCSIKLRKVNARSLVVSAYQPGVQSHPYLALGHGVVDNLGAQELTEEWQVCSLQLRQGRQVQDHLGTALVALSCCERERGYLTFTVDVLQLKKMKVLRLGNKVSSSFKTKMSVQVSAMMLTEGNRARKAVLGGTTLEQPTDSSEKGWEGIFKSSCSTTFSVAKDKVYSSCVVLEIQGRARHTVTSSEALLGKVILGPEELFGGEDQGQPLLGGPQTTITVPGDPLDARLTHWGMAIHRRAKIEMWHRLQI